MNEGLAIVQNVMCVATHQKPVGSILTAVNESDIIRNNKK